MHGGRSYRTQVALTSDWMSVRRRKVSWMSFDKLRTNGWEENMPTISRVKFPFVVSLSNHTQSFLNTGYGSWA
jgi:hypothetical protein